ncbi:Non-reducing end beta-L-arabinofuranosidase [Emticicia aquatica]|uniref:Non-reducing end beta-L-arabinofuranosidase n=1 Tax=Emticicia aquatica TaxID=1681835 RepID=A0ABM9AV09_9BACT|nr:beta-L-arabinofuranosidase domain-containing protein [Emticicia aquatica]CAH0997888.1 Non-reducing end beta-L-arabinofuranosidase [Emticicia aquatica]
MKRYIFLFFCLCSIATFGQIQKDYPYRGVPFTKVKLNDNFWLPKLEINRTVTIPWSFQKSKETGRIKNFEQAVSHTGKLCTTYPFDDSDIYKIIEGAAYSLHVKYDAKLDTYLDSLITLIGKAQEPDGYLYTTRTMGDTTHPWIGKVRYEKEHELSHELYNMGHFYEAATAHYLATNKRNMLDIAIKNADHLLTVFGPGKKAVAPGHQVIEIGLVKLYRVTGNQKYFDLSKFFIDCRGQRKYEKKTGDKDATVWQTGAYWQDNIPVTQQTEALGHSVRAAYLYAGMADVASMTNNLDYLTALNKIWDNAFTKKTYITGGLGQAGNWEGFGPDYELSNHSAYCETCAAIASVYWNHRMFMMYGDSKYIDILERTLYNGLISGIGLDGKSFNYENPMEYNFQKGKLSGENKRSPWFGCSCCPTNICRLMPSIPGYVYAQKDNRVYINLFMSNSTTLEILPKENVTITQNTEYPWQGLVSISVEPNNKSNIQFPLYIRIPGWAKNVAFPTNLYSYKEKSPSSVSIKINGNDVAYSEENGYAIIDRIWKNGDKVLLNFPMTIHQVAANEKVKDNIGKMAIERGPIVYCAEFADNNGATSNLVVPDDQHFSEEFKPNLLNGVMTLKGASHAIQIENNVNVSTKTQPLVLIPYYARSNRGQGEMRVWFPTKIKNLEILTE